ncbi:Adenine deaminase [Neolewinella maritima]|uniref:Adenine deaminase n=1 Tax=Neolewinella maritima TaxID=1383882 RepID=A0ABM9B1J9_9BACT|nr:amidohydrolase family protein [Neolewinella maritima]CAH1000848.1 Adenine deaminase [Neolewinella maritima]
MKSTLLRAFLLVSVLLVAVFFWAGRELDKMYGALTPRFTDAEVSFVDDAIQIDNISVYRVDSGSYIPHQTVRIREGVIVSVDSTAPPSADFQRIDGTGKYLLPGFVDSHVHLWGSKNDLLLYLSQGVTSIREMMGNPDHLDWRQSTVNRPTMLIGSNKVQSYGTFNALFTRLSQGHINSYDYSPTYELFDFIEERGYDFVKIGSMLDSTEYVHLLAAARDERIPVVGHIPLGIYLADFLNHRQYDIAHIEEIVKLLIRSYDREKERNPTQAGSLEEYVQATADQVAKKLHRDGTYVTTTLWLSHSFIDQQVRLDSTLSNLELAYVNPGLLGGTVLTSRAVGWYPAVNPYRFPAGETAEETEERIQGTKDYIHFHALVFKSLVANGVKLLAGTDANIPVAVPGFTLHKELQLMHRLGMRTPDIIRSSTRLPCEMMQQACGSIEPGYRADLVILRADPLQDIGNSDEIDGVVANGRYYDPDALAGMLRMVANLNRN